MKISKKQWGLFLGPIGFVLISQAPIFSTLGNAATGVLGTAFWMAVWWIFECVPMAATALLPIVLFPLVGGLGLAETTAAYGHKYIFLFLGGFILAIAIEKWNLHKRLALIIIAQIGTHKSYIILGFMGATAFLSMWISNTAAAVMILPVGMAIASHIEKKSGGKNSKFGKALMLSIAYSASIGGIATLIGTPPNLVMAGVIQEAYGIEITFLDWFLFAFPLSLILLWLAWFVLVKIAFKIKNDHSDSGKNEVKLMLQSLGKMSKQERYVMAIFLFMALAWIFRSFLLVKIFPEIDDTIIAIAGALLLFIIPANKEEALVSWEDTKQLPWGIIVLFGGGIALANGFESSGLAKWIGENLMGLQAVPFWALVLILVIGVNFLTEITSNLATTAMLLPILASVAIALNAHPFVLIMGATLAASCAFMLPVATPPNAVVFGSGYLKIGEMIRVGFWLNLISTFLVFLWVYFLLPLFWAL
jgi:solute carrier family 13 (sodium-dependent dicarboxylate transporter), member 2/3/5